MSTAASPPAGFTLLTDQVLITTITAPPLSAGNPLIVVLQLFASEMPPGFPPLGVQLFKDTVLVPYCTAPSSSAAPDPCIAKKRVLSNGNLEVTILTSDALFNFAVSNETSADLGLPLPPVGLPGGLACVTGGLTSNGHQVIAASNDIGFDPSVFSVQSCAIFPTLSSSYGKSLSTSVLGSGLERVGVSGGVAVMPDGLLYTCKLGIAAGAQTGTYALSNSPQATDQLSQPISGFGATTQVWVTNCNADCDGNGVVTIGEVVKSINLYLGQPLCHPSDPTLSCPVADTNHDQTVSIGEVIQAINKYLGGC